MSIVKHLVQLLRAAGGRRGQAAAVVVSARSDDVLLWHLDGDGWD